jgi:hypothetical protein
MRLASAEIGQAGSRGPGGPPDSGVKGDAAESKGTGVIFECVGLG